MPSHLSQPPHELTEDRSFDLRPKEARFGLDGLLFVRLNEISVSIY